MWLSSKGFYAWWAPAMCMLYGWWVYVKGFVIGLLCSGSFLPLLNICVCYKFYTLATKGQKSGVFFFFGGLLLCYLAILLFFLPSVSTRLLSAQRPSMDQPFKLWTGPFLYTTITGHSYGLQGRKKRSIARERKTYCEVTQKHCEVMQK